MVLELDFEDGVKEAIRRLEAVETKPVLAAVYGLPDHGKLYFIDKIANYFEAKGMSCPRTHGTLYRRDFEDLRDRPGDYGEIKLFHCGWDRSSYSSQHEDPNVLADEILNRKLDLNIGIYNPHMYDKLTGDYDLLISNPDSIKKPRL